MGLGHEHLSQGASATQRPSVRRPSLRREKQRASIPFQMAELAEPSRVGAPVFGEKSSSTASQARNLSFLPVPPEAKRQFVHCRLRHFDSFK